jgi:hypothetical protein
LSCRRGISESTFMHKSGFLAAAVGIVLFAGTPSALPQALMLELTPEQERTIYGTAIAARLPSAPPADLRVAVGSDVPLSVDLQDVPVSIEVPAIRGLRYMIVNRQVVLVDPGTRKIVRIIRQQDR